ncbi:MAG: tetratricopeptide repeat protein [Phormidesmis sp.]
MSINSDLRERDSVTEGDRALELFTGRYRFTRLLAERINNDLSPKILFLYGAGGNGKSLLLKYLQRNICKRLTVAQWEEVKGLPDSELATRLESLQADQHLPVPTALLDFGLPALNEVQPKDRFYGLLLLRKALGEAVAGNYRLRFARYDFACIWYLHSKGKSIDEIQALFPLTEIVGLVTTLTDAVTKKPAGAILKAFVDFGGKGWGEKLVQKFVEQGVDTQTQARIRSLDVDRALIDELPTLFADDLSEAMGQTVAAGTRKLERIVLFFDTHEAFWGAQRDLSSETYFLRDEWLRRLLRGLDLDKGIVVIVAGRDIPRWAAAGAVRAKTQIPSEYVQVEEVGLLAAGDAREYLQKVGIEVGALCEGLIRFASVNPQLGPEHGTAHPLHLGLCADVVLAAAERGELLGAADFDEVQGVEEQGALLIERLLRYVGEGLRYAIHGLSACRAFDRSIYGHLGKALNFATDEPTFRKLVRYSFVWQTQQVGETEQYRIHDLMRRLDDAPEVRQAHRVLAAYYQARQEPEEIYHLNQLNWEQGVNLWGSKFESALELSNYELCSLLLDIRQALKIETSFKLGLVSNLEGHYFKKLSKYDAARDKFDEAVSAYDKTLGIKPLDVSVLNNKGNSLRSTADILRILEQYDKAIERYEQSIASFDAALEGNPNGAHLIWNSRGLALTNLAELEARLSDREAADHHYQEAFKSYRKAFIKAPTFEKVMNNAALAQIGLAELRTLSSIPDALQAYDKAISACDEAISIKPNYVKAITNKGIALRQKADLQSAISQQSTLVSAGQAQKTYRDSIATFERAHRFAKDDTHVLNNEGLAFRNLGLLQRDQLQNTNAALSSFREALSLFNHSLDIAPNNNQILQIRDQLSKNLNP